MQKPSVALHHDVHRRGAPQIGARLAFCINLPGRSE
jgi:hypothetical protein